MRTIFRRAALAAALAVLTAPAVAPAHDNRDRTLRVATFNASLNRGADGQLIADLSSTGNIQAGAVAEVIQRVRPDVLLINEFDYDAQHTAARLFQDNYLSIGRDGAKPISYAYRYSAPSNIGIPSGLDLNNNGTIGGPDGRLHRARSRVDERPPADRPSRAKHHEHDRRRVAPRVRVAQAHHGGRRRRGDGLVRV